MGNKLSVGELIGEGPNSKVFRGHYQGSRVAIKKVNIVSEQFKDGGRQHEAMKNLNHSNVLKLFHWEDQNEFRFITILFLNYRRQVIHVFIYRYLILELCIGTLSGYISGEYGGPMPDVKDSLHQMAAGLLHIHDMGFVHRNIKPNNILISITDEPSSPIRLKISDFGSRKPIQVIDVFSITDVERTYAYLAPEVLEVMNEGVIAVVEEKMTKASDVFALGCVFYKYLTRGAHPFGEELKIIFNLISGEPELNRKLI